MSETRICHICGNEVEKSAWCLTCQENIPHWPDPATMTGEQRASEMEDIWKDVLEVPFEMMHARIEKLVGRPVWTHEFATPVWPMLVEEARTQPGVVDIDAIMGKVQIIKPGMPMMAVIVDPDTGEGEVKTYE